MSNVDRAAVAAARPDHLGEPGGLGAWFQTTDHRRIALMFLAWTAGAFLIAMLLSVVPLARTLAAPGLETREIFANLSD